MYLKSDLVPGDFVGVLSGRLPDPDLVGVLCEEAILVESKVDVSSRTDSMRMVTME